MSLLDEISMETVRNIPTDTQLLLCCTETMTIISQLDVQSIVIF